MLTTALMASIGGLITATMPTLLMLRSLYRRIMRDRAGAVFRRPGATQIPITGPERGISFSKNPIC